MHGKKEKKITGHLKREYAYAGWQKLCEGKKGLRQKVWTQTKILFPDIRNIKICRDLPTSWKSLGKKVLPTSATLAWATNNMSLNVVLQVALLEFLVLRLTTVLSLRELLRCSPLSIKMSNLFRKHWKCTISYYSAQTANCPERRHCITSLLWVGWQRTFSTTLLTWDPFLSV